MNNGPDFRQRPVESGTDVDRLLIEADGILLDNRRSAIVISLAITRIISQRRYGLRYLERRYRALDSATFLIAVPAAEHKVMAIDLTPMPYFLWIGVNGRREAEAKLAELKLSYAQNLDRLDRTGFLAMMRH
jgi:hypothetical protein